MSLNHNPSVVTNGLALYYDMSNTQKSWKGAPVTNLFPVPVPAPDTSVTFPIEGEAGFYRVSSGNYGGYDISPTDVVYRYNLTNNLGCHFHGVGSWPVTVGQPYTFSFDYYADLSVTGYPNTNYLANFEGGLSGSATDPTPTIRGVWKRMSFTSTASSATANFLLYPGSCGGYLGTGGFILYKNPQVELNSFSTPFVDGTRSNTQAILDLTKSNTLTAASLTYASDNTFSFNGSSNIITATNNTALDTQTPSVEVWVKTNATTQNGFWFEKGAVNTQYALFQEGANIQWRLGTLGDLSTTTATYMNTTNWYQVVGTYISGDRRLYINGVQVNSNATTGTLGTNSSGVSIGAYGGQSGINAYYYNGNISSVKIYNRVLTASEVLQNFNALRSRYGI